MSEKELTIKEVIYHDLDALIMRKLNNGETIAIEDLIDITSFLAASLFRKRWQEKGELTPDEINAILGNIGNFCFEHFGEFFTQQDFDKVVKISQLLLQKPTFDEDSKDFFESL